MDWQKDKQKPGHYPINPYYITDVTKEKTIPLNLHFCVILWPLGQLSLDFQQLVWSPRNKKLHN